MKRCMNKMYMELIWTPDLFIQIKMQSFNYLVMNIIIPQYYFFVMASFGKVIIYKILLLLPYPSPPPPYISTVFGVSVQQGQFFMFKTQTLVL